MQEVKIQIAVQYRNDGTVNKSALHQAICELLLTKDREELFKNDATYAGYTVSIVKNQEA